jgi:hypothetical protein
MIDYRLFLAFVVTMIIGYVAIDIFIVPITIFQYICLHVLFAFIYYLYEHTKER